MSFNPLDPFPPEPSLENPEVLAAASAAARVSAGRVNAAVSNIIDQPRVARIVREMVTWKTPHLGYVQMYLNPQQIKINSSKVIQSQRTKGGFIIQYGGENMDAISISGTTGAAGMEGINILQAIYRSEQLAFEGIAAALEEQLSNVQLDQAIGGLVTSFGNEITEGFQFGQNVLQITSQLFNGLNRPRPTLASLASNIDMFFQGVLYRGYFESFSVDESAAKPGWFEYHIEFKAYAKQGVRRNFMPWHRQPVGPSNPTNPLSFAEVDTPLRRVQYSSAPITPSDTQRRGGADYSQSRDVYDFNDRRSAAAGADGKNIKGLDLRR
jgi:hypothetical protein